MTGKIEKYDGPAGGWDALASSFHHVKEQGIVHVKEQGIVGLGSITMLKANQPQASIAPAAPGPTATSIRALSSAKTG